LVLRLSLPPPQHCNAFGWEVLCNPGFITDPGTQAPAVSHFGHGHLPCLFRTDLGSSLMAQGPINQPKDGISALAIIETYWSP
jgi:hypothetical protein